MLLVRFWWNIQFNFLNRLFGFTYDDVVEQYEAPNDKRLAYFDAVDSCVDVDAIGAEHWKHPHVAIVKEAKLNGTASQQPSHESWN
jgi:hypothetical protein